MKRKKVDAGEIWKKVDDELVPRLRLTVIERAVYSHLVRHTHLEGRARISFSVAWLAGGTQICVGTARRAVRRLISCGAVRLISVCKKGHLMEIRLPDQIRTRRARTNHTERAALEMDANLEEADFMRSAAMRELIHAREAGFCFYCRRRIHAAMRCVDHVVPQTKYGSNSYRNLVSACIECNSEKRSHAAADFLRALYRERRLSATELNERLRALDALAAGKLRPPVPQADKPLRRRGRPRIWPETRGVKVRPRHWAENGKRNFKFKIQHSK